MEKKMMLKLLYFNSLLNLGTRIKLIDYLTLEQTYSFFSPYWQTKKQQLSNIFECMLFKTILSYLKKNLCN